MVGASGSVSQASRWRLVLGRSASAQSSRSSLAALPTFVEFLHVPLNGKRCHAGTQFFD